MLCWVYGVLEDVWDSGGPCLELLKTSDWDKEGGWVASIGGGSFSEEKEGGVFPRSTARSILKQGGKITYGVMNTPINYVRAANMFTFHC